MFLNEYRIHLSKQVLWQMESFNPGLTISLVGIRKYLYSDYLLGGQILI